MKVKLDLEVVCPHCGEPVEVDWQITRDHAKKKLLIDTMCIHCGIGRREVDYV